MKTLYSMLDAATNGDFTESDFDESALSALETKMAEYLSASAVSSRNLAGEKKKIEEQKKIAHQQLLDEKEKQHNNNRVISNQNKEKIRCI